MQFFNAQVRVVSQAQFKIGAAPQKAEKNLGVKKILGVKKFWV